MLGVNIDAANKNKSALIKYRIGSVNLRFLLVFVGLLALRIPFYFTRHIQEDAYIFFRTASSLAATGIYGYNPGERVSSATSHLYVFYLTILRVIFPDRFIDVAQFLNTTFFLIGVYLIVAHFFTDNLKKMLTWILVACLPISLLISYSGMETWLLVFVIGVVIFSLSSERYRYLAYLTIFLFPWVRPEATAFGILLILYSLTINKKYFMPLSISLGLGILSFLAFNWLYFGSLLNQTIIAKLSSYHPDYSVQHIIQRILYVFASNGTGGIFSPLATKYLDPLGVFFFMVILLIFTFCFYKLRRTKHYGLLVLSFGISFLIPIAYAIAGVIFPWYLWPSTLFAYLTAIALLIEFINNLDLRYRRFAYGCFWLGVVILAVSQWIISLNWGLQERYYRGGIGENLHSISRSGDRLFLEPAGYIPYFSNRYTYDEIGIVSPVVTDYRKQFGEKWWIKFLMDYQPEYLIQRSGILNNTTLDGYTLSDREIKWFDRNYDLIRHYRYSPTQYIRNNLLLSLLSLGSAENYYLYKHVE